MSRYQKAKTNLDFTEARDSGISWDICKSAPRSRQITMPAPHHSVFPCSPTNSVKALTKSHKIGLRYLVGEVLLQAAPRPPGRQRGCSRVWTAEGAAARCLVGVPAARAAETAGLVAAASLLQTSQQAATRLTVLGGSVAEWSACWTRAQKGLGSNRSRGQQT